MKETKEVLAFGLSLFKSYQLAKADGKVGMEDLGLLIEPISKLVPAVENVKDAKDELLQMSDVDKQQLMAWAKAEFDIADDLLEKKIEEGMELALSIAKFVGVVLEEEPKPAA